MNDFIVARPVILSRETPLLCISSEEVASGFLRSDTTRDFEGTSSSALRVLFLERCFPLLSARRYEIQAPSTMYNPYNNVMS